MLFGVAYRTTGLVYKKDLVKGGLADIILAWRRAALSVFGRLYF
jgi:hypothetical protein